MRNIQYKKFSWDIHQKNWQLNRPNVAQFELTFNCGLHCKYCYSDCYNQPPLIKKELTTAQVKTIIDKLYLAGVLWLCFTGGDPLIRSDFLEIYAYAKAKGFIITIFTNGCSMTEKIAGFLKKQLPFGVEMTLPAGEKELYEQITQVKGSFTRVIRGIELILSADIALKIKTQVIKDNFNHLPRIKKFLSQRKIKPLFSYSIFPRLNHDLAPCALRISPNQLVRLVGKKSALEKDCLAATRDKSAVDNFLYPCAVGGGDGVYIDPYGYTFACNLIRKPKLSILENDLTGIREKIIFPVGQEKFIGDSKCQSCGLKTYCGWCPGQAYLATGDKQAPVDYCCRAAKALTR
jgi:radical SAM protein with 4Fe4S-binding SPASM domain